MRRHAAIALVLFAGCADRDVAAPAQASAAAVQASPPAPLRVAGRTLAHALADLELDGQLVVLLVDSATTCRERDPLDPQWSALLRLEIPPGPGGRFFAGSPVGVYAVASAELERVTYRGSEAIVTLEPFEPTIENARARGTVEIPSGTAEFDAELCGPMAKIPSLPETAPDRPASGTIDGAEVVLPRALVMLEREDDRPPYLDDLRLFQDANVTCESFPNAKNEPGLYVHSLGGTGSQRPLVGSPQPAWAEGVGLAGSRLASRMPAWVRFDRLAHEVGATVTGALVVEKGSSTKVAGTFTAEVCKR